MLYFFVVLLSIGWLFSCAKEESTAGLKQVFQNPPDSARPGVYWYFMDGNLSRIEMTKDLESMKEAGITNLIFLEVGIGVPRGSVDFMSEEWQELYVHAVREAERLGIKILLGAGPGWCGSGGPWVKPEESMKHLVYSELEIKGGKTVDVLLPIPKQRSTVWHTMKDPYYEDVAVYAVPASAVPVIEDINEKALYERDPYTSKPNVKPYLPSLANYEELDEDRVLAQSEIVDVTKFLQADGKLVWDAPLGNWTIIRMGKRGTGASTRPSPEPVIGLESNKMDTAAFRNHLRNFTDILLAKTAPRKEGVGWTGFHIDSWESGAQNCTDGIIEEFKQRRGYDPEPYLLAYTGRAMGSVEITERFLWDLRQTCKELVLENHVEFAKAYAHENGLELTIEPYDMNPAGDIDLGAIADVIMAEFWSDGFGFDASYAVLQATSIAHIKGDPVVGAEVFTSQPTQAWQLLPGNMKNQSDWALAHGINRFVYHTFAHKPLGDEHRPGMTMGRYGVHWDRGQTWWPMVGAYHEYISRCSHMMQQGQVISDILYLTPEGAPMVFTPPADAITENGTIPDKKGYSFDACSPKILMERTRVENGKIAFENATSYELLVLPNFETMTPELLEKVISLVEQGANVVGIPPQKSPSLVNYPACDEEVQKLAKKLWGTYEIPDELSKKEMGKGAMYWGGKLKTDELYPSYKVTAELLAQLNIDEDFKSDNNSIRFGHRKTNEQDIYFVANRTNEFQKTACTFRAVGEPELWIGTTGKTRKIPNYTVENGVTTIPLEFFPYESFFVTFSGGENKADENNNTSNFPSFAEVKTIEGAWDVAFNPKFGGPENIRFDELLDWTTHEMREIKYYSGIATYRKIFELETLSEKQYYIDLGEVNDIARVILNGEDLGVIWCAPWRINISAALKQGVNELEIEVANRWVNRLLGDQQEPDANVRTVKFENGLMGGKEYKTGRYTFTTKQSMEAFRFAEPLSSGLLGPVRILEM
ncbi:glycosyl hydrolase [Draconibacterium sediminis]|uniref:Glycosyl hydrolase n=1 Tax=Draconibacterium sediminis TaxID=1544798 RepID=A0A0D8JAD8_9BACT|nr:glycosyl hydrolase [Draconibacterium sediminis]